MIDGQSSAVAKCVADRAIVPRLCVYLFGDLVRFGGRSDLRWVV